MSQNFIGLSSEALTPLFMVLGYFPKDEALFIQALTHRSFYNESPNTSVGYNERLEFLGDAVLDLTAADMLMSTYPNDSEGSLSKKRASLVNEEFLYQRAVHLNLSAYLRLGKGEKKSGGLANRRLIASAFEAILGAIYLEGGYDETFRVVRFLFEPFVAELKTEIEYESDYKTRLQEKIQKEFHIAPTYELIEQFGPEHERSFRVRVMKANEVLDEGVGKSKKAAEQDAARKVLERILEGK